MNIPIPEDSITINGEIYVLVDDEESDECMRCALRGKCDTQNLLCQILDDAPQGKRFEKMEAKASPWHTVFNNSTYPKQDEIVVGFWISGSEPFETLCYYDAKYNQWFDCDTTDYGTGGLIDPPDYWIERPDKEVTYDGSD